MVLFAVTNVMAHVVEEKPKENLKKRTIYIWDLTKSMVGKGWVDGKRTPDVYEKVENVLISDIQKYAALDTMNRDVYIVPFQDKVLEDYVMTIDGCSKDNVDRLVNELKKNGPHCMYNVGHKYTNISDALEYAIKNYQDANRLNRIVLLTDGEQNTNGGMEKLREVVLAWDKAQADSLKKDKLYYILTTDNAKSPVGPTETGENTTITGTGGFTDLDSTIYFVAEDSNLNLLDKDTFTIKLACCNTENNTKKISNHQLMMAVSTADPSAPLQINEVVELKPCSVSGTYEMTVSPKCDLCNLRKVLPVGNTEVKLNLKFEPSEVSQPSGNSVYHLRLVKESITLSVHNEEQATLSIRIVEED